MTSRGPFAIAVTATDETYVDKQIFTWNVSGPVTVTFWSSGTQTEIKYLQTQFNKTHSAIKVRGQYLATADQSTAKEVAAIKSGRI